MDISFNTKTTHTQHTTPQSPRLTGGSSFFFCGFFILSGVLIRKIRPREYENYHEIILFCVVWSLFSLPSLSNFDCVATSLFFVCDFPKKKPKKLTLIQRYTFFFVFFWEEVGVGVGVKIKHATHTPHIFLSLSLSLLLFSCGRTASGQGFRTFFPPPLLSKSSPLREEQFLCALKSKNKNG